MAGQEYQRYEVTVTTLSPLRVGASEDPMIDIHGPVTMVNGRPAIQGSTLKGAYRGELESILITEYADNQAAARPCIPADGSNISPDERLLLNNKYRGSNCGYSSRQKKSNHNRGSAAPTVKVICPTCYLLGTMGLIGFVRVPYLFGDGGTEEGYSIRRDRAIGGAADRSNREFQYVPPGVRFKGTLEVLLNDHIRGWELGKPRSLGSRQHKDVWLEEQPWEAQDILSNFVETPFHNITRIGGFISKGFGDIKIELKLIEA